MNILPDLFLTFSKIGLFTFGGGYAMIPLIENICVERKKWISSDEMMNITVIAESTPGPIAINAATFVGYKQAGFIGAMVATFGMVIPSFIIIYIISVFFNNFLQIAIIANAFKGVKIAVGMLIFNAGVNMVSKIQKDALSRAIMIGAFISMMCINIFAWNFSSVILLLTAAVISLVYFCVCTRLNKKGGVRK